MKRHTLMILLLMFTVGSSSAQDCITGAGNIFNATMILADNVVSPPGAGEAFVAMADEFCVGQSYGTSVGATGTPVTIWGQDPLSPVRNGLQAGETFEILLKTAGGNVPLRMENDAIYTISASSADTTFSALLDSLTAEVTVLLNEVNSLTQSNAALQTQVDSLSIFVAAFPAEIATLQGNLDAAVATITGFDILVEESKSRLRNIIALIKSSK